jgi:hypothetical protein
MRRVYRRVWMRVSEAIHARIAAHQSVPEVEPCAPTGFQLITVLESTKESGEISAMQRDKMVIQITRCEGSPRPTLLLCP